MVPLEKVALAIRMGGFPKFASEYVRACGEEAPDQWDLSSAATHIGTKLAAQDIAEAEVRAGVAASGVIDEVKVASAPVDFTAEFHAVNRLASGLDKVASAGARDELAARRLGLWGAMKTAAERTPDTLTALVKTALRIWSETTRTGEKTASSRAEREAYALSFAANYLVDAKIAAAYEAREISLQDAVKLSHLTAEAALEDLSSVVKTCRGQDGSIKHASFFNWFKRKPTEWKPDPADFVFDHNRMAMHAPGVSLYPAEDDDSGDLGYFTYDAKPGAKSWVSLGGLMDDVNMRGPDVYKEIHNHFTAGAPLPNGIDEDELKLYKKQAAIDPRLLGAGIGAAGGAVAGAISDKDNRWRGAGMGAAMGAPTGALVGQMGKEIFSPNADKMRKGQEGLHRMRAYASHLGNGVPELVEQHANDILAHFGEGRKDVPPILASKFGPGIIDQMIGLKKTYSTPVI